MEALEPRFLAETGVALRPTFGAVGAIRERLFAGEPCDALILTEAMINELASRGDVLSGMSAPLGRVRTGIGIRSGDAAPDINNRDALQRSLREATDIYVPDLNRSTAGMHFAGVLDQLGIHAELAPRLRAHPNGATAMRDGAEQDESDRVHSGKRVLYTAGVTLVGPLPSGANWQTVYSVCPGRVSRRRREIAERFAQFLYGDGASPCG